MKEMYMDKRIIKKIGMKVIFNVLTLLLIIFLIILLVNIPPGLDFSKIDGKFISNMNYEDYKDNIVNSIRGLGSGEYLKRIVYRKGIPVGDAIKVAFGRSMRVFFISLIISIIIGIPKGIFDSRRKKKRSSFKLLQTLIPLSVPDVLTVSLVQLLAIYLYRNKFTLFGIGPIMYLGYENWTDYIYPTIALSLVPVSYIARITSTSIETVYDRDYILAARGKGCSEGRIIFNHTMRNVLTDLIASFPAIVSIMFSSLFIVERLFYFQGVTFEMMDFYSRPAMDGSTRIALLSFSVVLAIIYFLLYTTLDVVRQVLVPKLKNNSIIGR